MSTDISVPWQGAQALAQMAVRIALSASTRLKLWTKSQHSQHMRVDTAVWLQWILRAAVLQSSRHLTGVKLQFEWSDMLMPGLGLVASYATHFALCLVAMFLQVCFLSYLAQARCQACPARVSDACSC